jgi:hypothetical protein
MRQSHDEATRAEHIGFGAQAVLKVIPEAVTTNENGYLQVNKEQQKRLNN